MPDPAELDLRGLKCPLPALKTAAALRRLPAPASLIVVATDPLAAIDIPNAAREAGCRVVEQAALAEGGHRFVIGKPAAA